MRNLVKDAGTATWDSGVFSVSLEQEQHRQLLWCRACGQGGQEYLVRRYLFNACASTCNKEELKNDHKYATPLLLMNFPEYTFIKCTLTFLKVVSIGHSRRKFRSSRYCVALQGKLCSLQQIYLFLKLPFFNWKKGLFFLNAKVQTVIIGIESENNENRSEISLRDLYWNSSGFYHSFFLAVEGNPKIALSKLFS